MKYIFFISSIFFLFSCKNEPQQPQPSPSPSAENYSLIGGKTMGTTYSVKYQGGNTQQINNELDSLFKSINESVSVYEKESLISKFNAAETHLFEIETENDLNIHFITNFTKSVLIHKQTDGLFDPTVMPLVNYWGFGYTGKNPITSVDEKKIQSILSYVGMKKINYQIENESKKHQFKKENKNIQLDFGAIAKGYAVDKAGELLASKGIQNYLVEIGGEVVNQGKNPENKPWVIGINTPKENAKINDFQIYVHLSGKGLATSGNYRNFYEVNGKKYSHTINPTTGFPERSHLLSATIIADNCMTADAFATACMVGGLEKSLEIINNNASLEGYFVYSDDEGNLQSKHTEGFNKYLK